MKNTFGNALTVTLFGESHGAAIGAVLDGLAPGMPVDAAFINAQLLRRRPCGAISTARCEEDPFVIESGVYQGKTTGTPLCILIPNSEQHSGDYASYGTARPGHADYTGYCKFHGYEDPRGGGHFSGRLTAALVAAGAIVQPALRCKGVRIGTHLLRCAGVSDRAFADLYGDFDLLERAPFPVLDPSRGAEMIQKLQEIAESGDSAGGLLETAVTGMPPGVGEPWFDTVESVLSHALFAVPAVKGVAFGAGFAFADMHGSAANDPYRIENGTVVTASNANGGINGGITNGMPIMMQLAVKPTPSIFKEQKSVDFLKGENVSLQIKGRHDPCIAHRACPVVDAVCALALADLLTVRFGTDYLGNNA